MKLAAGARVLESAPMRVAVFAMPEVGHHQRLRPLIADLTRRGCDVHVFSTARFRDLIERAGGTFVDLFGTYDLAAVDSESMPVPCRYVSFAAAYADDVIRDLERLAPDLVVHDMFALVAQIAARRLGLPYVNVLVGHNIHPDRFRALHERDDRNAIAPACHRAVEVLRERHGLEDASPFSYLSALSPFLNLYCEPREFLPEADRESFEPVAFYGSVQALEEIEAREREAAPPPFGDGEGPRIYASFGTVIWRYWSDVAVESLAAIATAIEAVPGARGLISRGGNDPGPDAVRRLTRPTVAVEPYVDQWRVLRDADAFFTHHGLNSTHEAVFNRVPMGSFPFFGDQPNLARRCRELGLAVPLRESYRVTPAGAEDAAAVLDELLASRTPMLERLEEAREWELETIAARPAVIDRITALMAMA